MKQISPKQKKELAHRREVTTLLIEMAPADSLGRILCPQCRKLPDVKDGRGFLHLCHEKSLAQGGRTSVKNCYLGCRRCHSGEDGHRTEGMPKPEPVDRPPMPCLNLPGLHPYPSEMQTGIKRK